MANINMQTLFFILLTYNSTAVIPKWFRLLTLFYIYVLVTPSEMDPSSSKL